MHVSLYFHIAPVQEGICVFGGVRYLEKGGEMACLDP